MSTSPRPKRRFRFFQFSIRTMMLVTAAVAVFCNWYFQPQRRDEVLAGGELKLRRQVRVEMVDGPPPDLRNLPLGATPPPTPQVPVFVSHGSWTLRDKEDNLLVRGEYASDVPTGWWTIWHVSGKKAAEGRMKNGAKTGVWRTWYEDGTPQSLVTYSAISPSIPMSTSASAGRRRKLPMEASAYPREGVARAWYASGKLKHEGSYKDDLEDGQWQCFDERGSLTARGPFLRGKRHGSWTLVGDDGRQTPAKFVQGRTEEELRLLLERLTTNIQSSDSAERMRAMLDLTPMGEAAVPSLIGALSHSSERTRIAAVRSLIRLGPTAAPALPRLKELAAVSTDSPLRFQAMLAMYVIDPASRQDLHEPLAEGAMSLGDVPEAMDALALMLQHNPVREGQTMQLLFKLGAGSDANSDSFLPIFSSWDSDRINLLAHEYDRLSLPERLLIVETLMRLKSTTSVSNLVSTRYFVDPRYQMILEKLKSDPETKVPAGVFELRGGGRFINSGGFR